MIATDERQQLADLAEVGGWHRRDVERTDYYSKGGIRVQVLWQDGAVSGASLYHDDNMTSYSRELATVEGWLKR